jgi:tetratricopeptide (TPR) repeat protein
MFGRYRLDAALALVEPASTEFADLGDDPGLATLLGQLARFQMLRQVDFGAAIANADRALAISERLDRVDLVADTIITRGVALVSMGRAYEGVGCLETGLRLSQQYGLLVTEIRARINMGGPLTDRDPRAAFETSRVGLEQARRFGHQQGVSMLVVNASVGAIESGAWDFARAELRAGLDGAASEEERIVLLGIDIEVRVQSGMDAAAELDEAGAWLAAHVAAEPYLESAIAVNDAIRALQRGDHLGASARYLDAARLDPYNAVTHVGEAVSCALLARDRDLARACADALRETGSHAAIARITIRATEAGVAGLDGAVDAARAGLLEAYAELKDLGATRRQALTGLVIATLLDSSDPRVRAAVDESRRLFEQMGAGLWLGLLDEALATSDVTPASPASEPAAGTAEGAASAAPA